MTNASGKNPFQTRMVLNRTRKSPAEAGLEVIVTRGAAGLPLRPYNSDTGRLVSRPPGVTTHGDENWLEQVLPCRHEPRSQARVASCPTRPTESTAFFKRHPTSTAFCAAQNLSTCRCRRRPSTSHQPHNTVTLRTHSQVRARLRTSRPVDACGVGYSCLPCATSMIIRAAR